MSRKKIQACIVTAAAALILFGCTKDPPQATESVQEEAGAEEQTEEYPQDVSVPEENVTDTDREAEEKEKEENGFSWSGDMKMLFGDHPAHEYLQLPDLSTIDMSYKAPEITEKEVKGYASFSKNAVPVDDPDAKAREGDYVNVILDVKSEWYSYRTEEDLWVGEGLYDKPIEDAIKGMRVGDEKRIEFKEEGNINSTECTITLLSISRAEEAVEDEYSIAETEYKELRESAAKDAFFERVFAEIRDKSTVLAYPGDLAGELRQEYEDRYSAGYGSIETFFKTCEVDPESFYKDEETEVKKKLLDRMVGDALCEKAGLTENDPEYKELLETVEEDTDKKILYELAIWRIAAAKQ